MTDERAVRHRSSDPVDEIWLGAARRLGLTVVRASQAYAATDGSGRLVIGDASTLDADDCLAQMILHEICHWLVEGDDARERADWGLDNESERDVPREQACLRLQAALLRRHGLRRVLAPTTDFRGWHDALPEDPLSPREDPTSVAARLGLVRAEREPFFPVLHEALAATAAIARTAAAWAGREREPSESLPSLWLETEAAPAPHPTGLPPAPASAGRCGDCVWAYQAGPNRRCRRADDQRIEPDWPACESFESVLDCRTCGACCREAFESVTVRPGEPVIELHPELVVELPGWIEIARRDERCAALEGGLAEGFSCSIYADRPSPCRELAVAGPNCLLARRRVGLSS